VELYLLRRLASSLLLLWLVVTFTFLLVRAAPGSPVQLFGSSRSGAADQQARLERFYGLDKPLHEQYLIWLSKVVRGDWGVSMQNGRPVAGMIAEALPNSVLLAVAATAVEYAFALSLGVWAVRRRGSLVDRAVTTGSLVLYSVPPFWLAIMAILLFTLAWPLLPTSGMWSPGATGGPSLARLGDLLRHLLLPATVLGLTVGGGTLQVATSCWR
jgi:peptide/nickel transport system permease protein